MTGSTQCSERAAGDAADPARQAAVENESRACGRSSFA
jgi:hypothetical protein